MYLGSGFNMLYILSTTISDLERRHGMEAANILAAYFNSLLEKTSESITQMSNYKKRSFELRGPGVFEFGILKNEFACVCDEGHGGLPDAFYQIKKYCSQPELSRFQIWILHTITLRSRALIAIISKSKMLNFKIYLLLHFLRYRLETWQLCSMG